MSVLDNPQLIDSIFHQLKNNSRSQTKSIQFRKQMFQNMITGIKIMEQQFHKALQLDLGADPFFSKIYSLQITIHQIQSSLKNLHSWAKPRKKDTPLSSPFLIEIGPGKSYILPQPLGIVLVISAWNYPVYTSLGAIVPAIAAGNCVILKPSQLAPHTSNVLKKYFQNYLDSNYYQVIEGQVEVSKSIIKYPFDLIIFTGSSEKGKLVAKAAADNLTPCILQLGGKCPTIVDEDANIEVSAMRISAGRFCNSGQTCVACDFVIVHKNVSQKFKDEIKKQTINFYGKNAKESKDLCKIINKFHVQRLESYIKEDHGGEIILGGNILMQQNFVEPTIIFNPKKQSKLMTEQIFGPILPIIEFNHINQAIKIINQKQKPLAIYYFGIKNKKLVITSTSSGGVLVNDATIQIINDELPFGGVGKSGYGAYHGIYGFDSCSHLKGVLQKGFLNIYPITTRYPPFTQKSKTTLLFILQNITYKENKLKKVIVWFVILMIIFFLWYIKKIK